MGANTISATYQNARGETTFNEAALFTRPHFLCTQPDIWPWPAAPAAVGAFSAVLPMEVAHDASFLGSKFLLFNTAGTANFIQIQDRALGRWIAKSPIHLNSIAGVAGNPFYLMDPLWIDEGRDISVRFTLAATAGAGNEQVKFYVEGARYFARDSGMEVLEKFVERKRQEHLHNYLTFLTTVVSPVVLPAGAPGAATPFFIEIPEEYAFTVRKITAVTAAGAAIGAGSFTIQMFDQRGNPMSNQPMDNVTLGIGTNPEVLRQGWTIPPNRRIRIVMQDWTGGGLVFYLTFTGAAHYVKET